MFSWLWRRLAARLFLSYLVVILVGVSVLGLTAEWSAPVAFARHLQAMSEMMGRMMGQMHGVDLTADLYDRFRQALHESLAWAVLASGGAAALVSWFVAQRVTQPLRAMIHATQRIAEGHYEERVPVPGSLDHPDELAELALHFNRMAERLAQTESLRRRLIGDVAHELRTPLTTIRGYVEGLMDGVLPATPETYRLIYEEADRLSRLVNDLQELSRVEAGAEQLNLRPTAVADLIEDAAQRFRPFFDEKGIHLEVDVPSALPPVLADRDRILQVLSNLLSNALRYTPPEGRVTLRATRHGRYVAITVQDTGIGIPLEHLPHIFERFYRVDPSRSRAQGGSGIGLTIAKHLVEAHGGCIWAESPGPGQGSTFTFTLPIAEA